MNEPLITGSSQPPHSPEDIVQRTLHTVRRHLGMEIAYLSEFVGNKSVVRAIDPAVQGELLSVDEDRALHDVYCQKILDGELPEVIPDVRAEPAAAAIRMTDLVPVGSHAGVPIRNPDGSIYGMFCCLSRVPNPSLTERDHAALSAFAELTADQLRGVMQLRNRRGTLRKVFSGLVEERQFDIVLQPIVRLETASRIGFEALSRFRGKPYRPPNLWFIEAAEVGLAVELELAAMDEALKCLDRLPADAYLAVNASPQALLSERLSQVLEDRSPGRVVVEVTEHVGVGDYAELVERAALLRALGVRLAVDDTGSGIAGLHHMLRLSPDIIKLDRSLTVSIDEDPARRALANALVSFSKETSSLVVAEGIETAGELATLKSLGVFGGQGHIIGMPTPLLNVESTTGPRTQGSRSI